MVKMIKRICFIIISLLMFIAIKSYANEIIVKCPENIDITKSNTIECILSGKLTDNINSVKIRYSIPKEIEFDRFIPSDNWELQEGGLSSNTGFIVRINDGNLTGNIEFGKFVLRLPEGYDGKDIKLKFYEFDATNTSCEVVDFENDVIEKSIVLTKTDKGYENDSEDSKNEDEKTSSENSNSDKNEKEIENSNKVDDKEYKDLDEENDSKDDTLSDKKFGQYGNKNVFLILISTIILVVLISAKKLKELKFI